MEIAAAMIMKPISIAKSGERFSIFIFSYAFVVTIGGKGDGYKRCS